MCSHNPVGHSLFSTSFKLRQTTHKGFDSLTGFHNEQTIFLHPSSPETALQIIFVGNIYC